MPTSSFLHLKHLLIGTPLERPLNRLRWMAEWRRRRRHPELFGMFNEAAQIEAAVRRLVTPETNCIDGGSHIGTMLCLFTTLAPTATHIAFEPSAQKAAWIRRRWPAAEVHQAALGAERGTANFTVNRTYPGMSTLHPDFAADEHSTSEVDVVTIDEIVGDREIGFVKLDVEGDELDALRGACKTFARCRPALLFECGPPWLLAGLGYSRAEMFDFVNGELGYSLWLVSDYLFSREPMGRDEFERCGTYPFPGFNFVALPIGTHLTPLAELDRSTR